MIDLGASCPICGLIPWGERHQCTAELKHANARLTAELQDAREALTREEAGVEALQAKFEEAVRLLIECSAPVVMGDFGNQRRQVNIDAFLASLKDTPETGDGQ